MTRSAADGGLHRAVAAPGRAWRALAQTGSHQRRLYYGKPSSARVALGRRMLLVAALVAAVILLFAMDRGGLQDNTDGHVSLPDVVYFAVITITTVGYGDIVPVTTSARLIDAFVVTPVRLFVWAIFFGTAYQLVARRMIEDIHMRLRQANLTNHTVICGFGLGGRSAAAELIRRGTDPKQIVVVDLAEDALLDAAEMGMIGMRGDATREAVIRDANISEARTAFVCLGRDDTTVLATLTISGLAPEVRIVSMVKEAENETLVQKGGAAATICPSAISGVLMANSLDTSRVASYVYDMLTIDGRVSLSERRARPADVGKHATVIEDGLALRIHRGERVIGFWERDAVVAEGDQLIILSPRVAS